jgi:hypothetical protein
MRKAFSGDTGKEMDLNMKTDVSIWADGEGGVFITMCWHEIKPMGSVVARIIPDKVPGLIKAIQEASEDVDT